MGCFNQLSTPFSVLEECARDADSHLWSFTAQTLVLSTKVMASIPENLNTTEARATQKHFGQLMTAIQEPQIPALAAAFFSDSIVASDTIQFVTNVAVSKAVRCTALLLAVVNHVEVHPGKFEQVVGILSQETNLTELAATMSETCRKFDLLRTY